MAATRTPAQSRLPGGDQPSDSRATEVVKGLLALLAIAVLVIGVPVALYTGFGTPWPDTAPGTSWIYADFTPRDVLAVLVGIVWLGWLHFVVCLLVEFIAERRGRGLSPHVPGGSVGTQPLARRLVGAVLLLSTSFAVALPSATALTTDGQRSNGVSVSRVAADAGDSARARPDVRAHEHDTKATTAAFTDTEAGVLHKYVEVQPPAGRHYDTMWGIAERYLGDGLRYKEIVALNRGVVQPDGTTLKDPDLIYPGYILKLPADAEGPGLRTPPAEGRMVGRQVTGPAHSSDDGAGESDRSGQLPQTPPADTAGSLGAGSDTASVLTATGFTAGGVLLAAGLVLSLRRRRGWDGGPHPRGGKPLERELALRGGADEPSAVFVDKVLRSLAGSLPAGGSLPGPTSCALGADGLAVTFPAESRVRLPAPWQGEPGGRTWMIHRRDAAAVSSRPADLSPWPGLVALGRRRDGVETLLDIESLPGVASISGDLDVARQIAVAIGLSLATNRWSDAPRVDFVGFADDLTELAPDRIRHYDDLTSVLEQVDARRRRHNSACAAQGLDSVRAGRLGEADARLWGPEFLILSGVPSADDAARLADAASDPRSAIGVVVVGDLRDAPVRMVASTSGQLVCGPLGIDVSAHRVAADTYRDALSIFDAEVMRSRAEVDPDLMSAVAPAALDVDTAFPVEISTLGPVRVEAPGEVDADRRDLLTELVVYLALHPEGIHPNVLSAVLWPRGVGDDVRDSALAQAASWLGSDEAGVARLSLDDQGRWRLAADGVRLDWDVFRALANRSVDAADPQADLALALSLVRGAAWSDLPAGRYAWLASGTLEADVRVAVVAVARRLASSAAEAGDPLRARDALLSGLTAAPACEEIWRDALALADRFAGKADVHAVATDMYAAITRYGSPRGAQAETDAMVDELLPGFRRGSAA